MLEILIVASAAVGQDIWQIPLAALGGGGIGALGMSWRQGKKEGLHEAEHNQLNTTLEHMEKTINAMDKKIDRLAENVANLRGRQGLNGDH